jgi:hypothetical protein
MGGMGARRGRSSQLATCLSIVSSLHNTAGPTEFLQSFL